MSVSASIDVVLFNKQNYIFSILDVINMMLNNNWKIENEGKISYLPLGDNGLYDWTENVITENQLKQIVRQKELEKETIGVIFYWENTDIGVSMLVLQDNQITFNLNINRVQIESLKFMKVTDVNWYLNRIIPCLNTEKFKVQDVKFHQDWLG